MVIELVGKKVKEIRDMSKTEMDAEYWDRNTKVIVLNDGTRLYASCDNEGNGPGTLFGRTVDDRGFALY